MKIELKNEQVKTIENFLDENRKLSCAKALAVAKKLKIDSFKMIEICDQLKIKIIDCELGVFGKKSVDKKDQKLYEKIVSYSDDNKVTCKRLWEEAKVSNMKNIRSSIKNTEIFVTYCQLGCFKEDRKHGSKI